MPPNIPSGDFNGESPEKVEKEAAKTPLAESAQDIQQNEIRAKALIAQIDLEMSFAKLEVRGFSEGHIGIVITKVIADGISAFHNANPPVRMTVDHARALVRRLLDENIVRFKQGKEAEQEIEQDMKMMIKTSFLVGLSVEHVGTTLFDEVACWFARAVKQMADEAPLGAEKLCIGCRRELIEEQKERFLERLTDVARSHGINDEAELESLRTDIGGAADDLLPGITDAYGSANKLLEAWISSIQKMLFFNRPVNFQEFRERTLLILGPLIMAYRDYIVSRLKAEPHEKALLKTPEQIFDFLVRAVMEETRKAGVEKDS